MPNEKPENLNSSALVNAINRLRVTIENRSFFREDWHEIGTAGEPAFQNSWVNYDSGANTQAGFMKDALGYVRLKGLVKSGTIGQIIFTLPTGYRPPANINFSTVSNGAFACGYIGSNGNIYPNTGNNAYWSIENLSYKV